MKGHSPKQNFHMTYTPMAKAKAYIFKRNIATTPFQLVEVKSPNCEIRKTWDEIPHVASVSYTNLFIPLSLRFLTS